MSIYSNTLDTYEFIAADRVTIKLLKEPYTGIVVCFLGEVSVLDETSPTGEGLQFDYEVTQIPDGFDVDLLNHADFTNYLGQILLGWVEKHFEENGGGALDGVVEIHAAVSEPEQSLLEPKSIEYDQQTGATTLNYL